MTTSELLHAARERWCLTTTCLYPGQALQCSVDYSVYVRALFLLKRGLGVSPRTSIFEWHRDAKPTFDTILDGFHRAIVLAEES